MPSNPFDRDSGQWNVPTSYLQDPRKSRLDVFQERERERVKAYQAALEQIGMRKADAEAFVYRMAHVPMPNPGPERAAFIAEDWMKRHTLKKAQSFESWKEQELALRRKSTNDPTKTDPFIKDRRVAKKVAQDEEHASRMQKRGSTSDSESYGKKSLLDGLQDFMQRYMSPPTVEKQLERFIRKDHEEAIRKALGDGSRFKALVEKLIKKGHSKESAEKIAASIGRKKYGGSKMGKWAAKGRK